MAARRSFFLLFQVFFYISTYSQNEPSTIDSLVEEIIYEYDTVYLQPDTIRIVDTLYTKEENISKKERKKRKKRNLNKYFKFQIPKSISFQFAPTVIGNFSKSKIADTINLETVISYIISTQLNYDIGKYNLSIGIGYSPFKEIHNFKNSYFSKIPDSTANGITDSVIITNKYSAEYSFSYINFQILIGRNWIWAKNITTGLQAGFVSDFLVGYKQASSLISHNSVKDFNLSICLSLNLGYKLTKHLELFITPQYQYSLFNEENYPHPLFQKTGIGVGLNIFFK